jgi:cell division protein FtsZ
MIELTRTHEIHSYWKVKVLGIGGAGTHAVDRLNRDGLSGVELLVANTDARALSAAYTSERISLGQSLTRGLGAGGDPELGRTAALESIAVVGERLSGASLVVLMVGLGGGTGSGAAPCIAQIARAQGAHVAVFATLPFSFEGRRRREQALEALDALRLEADLVICFENDRMSNVADPASGIEDAFQSVDSLLAQSVRALASMTRRRNVLHSGLDEIAATVAGPRCTALFGYGAADGEERARAAVARAFSNPLLNFGDAVASIESLWVYVAGGPDMRFSEVQNLMQEVAGRIPQEVRLYFGAAVDPQLEGAISVTLLAGIPSGASAVAAPELRPAVQVAVFAPVSAPAQTAVPVAPTPPVVLPEPVAYAAPVYEPEPEPEQIFNSEPEVTFVLPPTQPEEIPVEPVAEVQPWVEEIHEPLQPVDAAPAPVRHVPTPPFELSKERRRETAIHPPQEPVPQVADLPAESRPVEAAEPLWEPVLPLNIEATEAAPVDIPPPFAPPTEQRGAEAHESPQEAVARKAKENVQEQMRFEPVNRGRFEKTDPTIVDGEDLDVPTFMRQGVPLEP